MYLSCPFAYDLQDAEWFENIQEAKDNAVDWCLELNGKNVIVYEAIDGPDGYVFIPLTSALSLIMSNCSQQS